MNARGRGRWIAALGALLLGLALGCGGTPDEASETDSLAAQPVDTPQGGTTAWARQLGGRGTEMAEAIAPGPDGGTVLVTRIGEPGPGVVGPTSVGLVRLRPDGTVSWSREFRTAGAAIRTTSVAVTGLGNVFLSLHAICTVGTSCPDFGGGEAAGSLLVKFSPAGAFRWQRAEHTSETLSRVAVSANGSAAVAVLGGGTAPGAARLLVYRWDGVRLWNLAAPAVNGTRAPRPSALAFDRAGNLVVGDRLTLVSLNASGAVRWTARLAPPEVLGTFVSIGTTDLGTVVALASHLQGTVSWAGTQSTVVGSRDSAVFLAVAEEYGAPRFGRVLEPEGLNPKDAAVDPAGRVAILTTPPNGCADRLEKWNLAGAQLWTRALGTCDANGQANGFAVAVDPVSHHVRVAGAIWRTADVGTGVLTSRGGADDLVVDVMP